MTACYAPTSPASSRTDQQASRCDAAQPARSPRTTWSSGGLLTLAASMVLKAAAETGRAK